jgi:hypothetical protein
VAFEEFKAERGSEINRIWNENKEILAAKRRLYSEFAHRINETKGQIDFAKSEVERKRGERANMGEFVSEMGEPIIDEEEFALIKHLQDLKGAYRDDFDKWRELKAEIVYCQNLVEQCRQRLIQEFEIWYNEVYMNGMMSVGQMMYQTSRNNNNNLSYIEQSSNNNNTNNNNSGYNLNNSNQQGNPMNVSFVNNSSANVRPYVSVLLFFR